MAGAHEAPSTEYQECPSSGCSTPSLSGCTKSSYPNAYSDGKQKASASCSLSTLPRTIDGTCHPFSTATHYITQSLLNISGDTSVSAATTGGCTITRATTADIADLLCVVRLMWAGSNPLLGQEEHCTQQLNSAH